MRNPDGSSAAGRDPVMVFNSWANQKASEIDSDHPENQQKGMIFAGMGRPTYQVNSFTIECNLAYWMGYKERVKAARLDPAVQSHSLAVDYGDGRGDLDPRTVMAEAMTKWYNSDVNSDNVLFTVGGAGALRIIFETFNKRYADIPKYRVITPFPYYTLYADNRHQLHPIDVMKEPGYKLTAKTLEESIKGAILLAKQDNNAPKVVLLCNPGNPLGTVILEDELKKIAEVLRKYPDLHIVIDEAYAEMYWKGKKVPSLLELAPDLKNRVIILRSATKALSCAGERMAMLMAFDPDLMNSFRNISISSIGHAPRSSQLAYAYTMKHFSDEEKKALDDYYLPKVDYVFDRAAQMGASMPDPSYKVEGTFYVTCDFSDLMGEEIPVEAQYALEKKGKIETSEDLVYSLLVKERVMVAPGCYFGMPPRSGYIRITCSGTQDELKALMDRLEDCLLVARQKKAIQLIGKIKQHLSSFPDGDFQTKHTFLERFNQIIVDNGNVIDLKTQNNELNKLLHNLNYTIAQANPEKRKAAALTIFSFLKSFCEAANFYRQQFQKS